MNNAIEYCAAKPMYRVHYFLAGNGKSTEAYFDNKPHAEAFAAIVDGHVNKWLWNVKVEK